MTAASPDTLPDDLDALRAIILAERAEKQLILAERDQLTAANDKLHHIIAVLRRARFGRKSERLSEDQLNLVLEELETASAKAEAEEDKTDEGLKRARAKKRRANRGSLPENLPRIEQVIEPESTICPWLAVKPCTSSARISPSASTRCRPACASSSPAVPNMAANAKRPSCRHLHRRG